MKKTFFSYIALLCLLVSCEWKPWQDFFGSSSVPKASIRRYDRIVDEYVALNSYASWEQMTGQYPQETKLLIEDVLGLGHVDEARIERKLRLFCLDSIVQVLFQEVHRQYPDMKAEEEALYTAFMKVKKADSAFRIPRIYTQISALNQSIVVGDSILGISLDKYLGEEFPLYRQYYSDYQIHTMRRDRIVPEALFFYLMAEYPVPGWPDATVRDYVFHVGKLHWIVSDLLDFSMEQESPFDGQTMAWCKKHETDIRDWVRENNLLAEKDSAVVRMMLVQSPATPALGKDAPGQLGVWLGCRIMESYMEKHPGLTVAELLNMQDYEKMLKESGYDLL